MTENIPPSRGRPAATAMGVRPASPDDAAGIAAVHLASWRATYADDAPPGWLAAQTLPDRVAWWTGQLEVADARVLVAIGEAGAVLGFCSLALPGRDEDADEDTAEILAFYVDPARWRAGAGSALMSAALDLVARAGLETMTLWVLQTNARARAFYARFAFADDGARKPDEGGWPTQLRLRRAVDPVI